jgi:Domain of unknown function (DUF4394)
MPVSRVLLPLTLTAAALLGACASIGPLASSGSSPRKETVVAVTDAAELIKFNAGQPSQVLARQSLKGLPAGERLLGIDYRVARGVLYALSSGGLLYTLDTSTGQLKPVGTGAPLALPGGRVGFDFNPAADRIRVVGTDGGNLRLHPETGARVATDPELHYAPGDVWQHRSPRIAGAAYTYNKKDDRLTTNYALDLEAATLVTQGSVEGQLPAVSPNTGRLFTVGALGIGAVDDAAFDIADTDNSALAALRQGGATRLHLLDLATGRAQLLGTVGDGRALWGMAIEP